MKERYENVNISHIIDLVFHINNKLYYIIFIEGRITESLLKVYTTLQESILYEENVPIFVYTKKIKDHRGLNEDLCLNAKSLKDIEEFFKQIYN